MNQKKLIVFITTIIILFIAFLSFSNAMGEQKDMEKLLNETYEEYISNPERFKLAKAEILEEYDCQTGERLSFFSSTNQWLVKVHINEKTECNAYVMRDNKTQKIGDTIDVAYRINKNNNYTQENTDVTQLRYISNNTTMNSYNIIMAIIGLLFIGTVVLFVISILKSNR